MKASVNQKHQKVNAPVNGSVVHEPQSAHASPVVKQYVAQRRAKAEQQSTMEQQSQVVWSRSNYTIL